MEEAKEADIAKHFVALSTNEEEGTKFGSAVKRGMQSYVDRMDLAFALAGAALSGAAASGSGEPSGAG